MKNLEPLECLVVGEEQPDASVIWLHGLGDSGYGHAPVVQALSMPADWKTRFILPHAPQRPVTVNGGMPMPAWYDILAMDIDREVDAEAIEMSTRQVEALIQREIDEGITRERIFIAGFSQGGAIALHCGLSQDRPLGGIIALSTYLALPAVLDSVNPALEGLRIFVGHGQADEIVPVELGQRAASDLASAGFDVDLKVYPGMGHSLCPEEIEAVSAWFKT